MPGAALSAHIRRQMETLLAAQPESGPWLGVLSAALEACADPAWDEAAATATLSRERAPGQSLLAGAQMTLEARLVDRWVRRLLAVAGEAGVEAAPLRAAARDSAFATLVFLIAAINGDNERLRQMAHEHGLDPDALAAVANLAAMPPLQTLHRRFASAIDAAWNEGFCPICGGWPLLVEQRGLERARRLRCGRCGGDWTQPGIRCPYCGVSGHTARSALVAEGDREARTIEVCSECHGYVKRVSTLGAWAGDEVVLADLATIELDLVALERDLQRPAPRPLAPPMVVIAV
jgi:FdhE protein